MSEFQLYFSLGREHIMDVNGYDHILFVIALSTVYLAAEWKKVLILVTAFTIGHSITLGLVTLDVFRINSSLVEFLIPITILITALSNIWNRKQYEQKQSGQLNYVLALFFGLIHGMGFSSYLKALLGQDTSIVSHLFAFNLGLEAGQIIIVVCFLALGYLINKYLTVSRTNWILAVSSAVAGVAVILIIDTKFW